MTRHSIPSLLQSLNSATAPLTASIHACVAGVTDKQTRDGKPFLEVKLKDAENEITLRVWSNHPMFARRGDLTGFVEVSGTFRADQYGVDSADWSCRPLDENERSELLAGSPERRQIQAARKTAIFDLIGSLGAPFREFALLFMTEHESAFFRAAAARGVHHARPGGLSEHVALMMQSADALSKVYPSLNRDLLITGALVHDCGKMWENQYTENSLDMPFSERAELLGHICIGVLVTRRIWEQLIERYPEKRRELDQARLHLDHLILSHHGQMDWGSPVLPKTPEAMMLHFIDNIDAKMEMFSRAYATLPTIGEGVYDKYRTLDVHPVKPLAQAS